MILQISPADNCLVEADFLLIQKRSGPVPDDPVTRHDHDGSAEAMFLPVPDASRELILEVHLDSSEEIAERGLVRGLTCAERGSQA